MSNRTRPIIQEDYQTLQELHRKERDADNKQRLQMLVLFRSQQAPRRIDVATQLGVHRQTITCWLSLYEQGGIEDLLQHHPPGRKPGQRLLPQAVFDALKRRLDSPEGFASYLELQQWLHTEYGLAVNYKSLHALVRYRLKAKLKVPRPEHPKKNRGCCGVCPSSSATIEDHHGCGQPGAACALVVPRRSAIRITSATVSPFDRIWSKATAAVCATVRVRTSPGGCTERSNRQAERICFCNCRHSIACA